MNLFLVTMTYRLKSLCTGAFGIAFFLLALAVAACPFVGLMIPDAPVPVGWIDEDDNAFSARLLQNVEALDVVWVTHGDRETLAANLQTGRLEGVFVIKKGFENAVKSGAFEGTLELLRSPYSTAAGVISESVGSQALRLWLSCSSANEARDVGGDTLSKRVFTETMAGTDAPILRLDRKNEAGNTALVTPLLDASLTSLYLLCALAAFFMMTGLALSHRETDFAARLKSRAFSIEKFYLAQAAADTVYMLPSAAVPLTALGLAGEGERIVPMCVMFALYVLSFGGISALLCKIRNQTVLMLSISALTIANVMFGSMLVKLPAAGMAFLLPSRWMSAADTLGLPVCIAGLAACAVVYNAMPFLLRRRND